ncbi:DNA polymerase III subunit chi [Sphingobium subterraneum]|uniref:DNA polymerase-3 subunit chi n=1 Tax=Sphingobium subterraneum TaxID=627688 RepID=A0A841J125_9SPHN|nr:DNA polymerase-3 subunit chi [Sphingobium subterraneum]
MQVDFYQLSRDPVEQVVPAIARRVLDQGGRLLLVDGREGGLDRLSRALWEVEPASFLAHGREDDPRKAIQPILLSTRCNADNGARFIALADGVWRDEATGFERAFYFFDDAAIEGARASWRALTGREDVTPRFWRQEGRRWVQGP